MKVDLVNAWQDACVARLKAIELRRFWSFRSYWFPGLLAHLDEGLQRLKTREDELYRELLSQCRASMARWADAQDSIGPVDLPKLFRAMNAALEFRLNGGPYTEELRRLGASCDDAEARMSSVLSGRQRALRAVHALEAHGRSQDPYLHLRWAGPVIEWAKFEDWVSAFDLDGIP
jgi:hypothetical protein